MTIIHIASVLLAINILVDIASILIARKHRNQAREMMAENVRIIERLEDLEANRIPTHHHN